MWLNGIYGGYEDTIDGWSYDVEKIIVSFYLTFKYILMASYSDRHQKIRILFIVWGEKGN